MAVDAPAVLVKVKADFATCKTMADKIAMLKAYTKKLADSANDVKESDIPLNSDYWNHRHAIQILKKMIDGTFD